MPSAAANPLIPADKVSMKHNKRYDFGNGLVIYFISKTVHMLEKSKESPA